MKFELGATLNLSDINKKLQVHRKLITLIFPAYSIWEINSMGSRDIDLWKQQKS